jgi:hypothetical protein
LGKADGLKIAARSAAVNKRPSARAAVKNRSSSAGVKGSIVGGSSIVMLLFLVAQILTSQEYDAPLIFCQLVGHFTSVIYFLLRNFILRLVISEESMSLN